MGVAPIEKLELLECGGGVTRIVDGLKALVISRFRI